MDTYLTAELHCNNCNSDSKTRVNAEGNIPKNVGCAWCGMAIRVHPDTWMTDYDEIDEDDDGQY